MNNEQSPEPEEEANRSVQVGESDIVRVRRTGLGIEAATHSTQVETESDFERAQSKPLVGPIDEQTAELLYMALGEVLEKDG